MPRITLAKTQDRKLEAYATYYRWALLPAYSVIVDRRAGVPILHLVGRRVGSVWQKRLANGLVRLDIGGMWIALHKSGIARRKSRKSGARRRNRCLRSGVIAMLVCGVSWSRPITCEAQSAADGEFAARKADAENFFRKRVTPFIKTYCIGCHQNRRPTEAGVNFSPALKNPGHAAFSQQWKKAAARVKAHDMPPEDMEQPTAEDRQMFSVWLAKIKYLSPKDPGPFVIRRLTKTEYGNTLHDQVRYDAQ